MTRHKRNEETREKGKHKRTSKSTLLSSLILNIDAHVCILLFRLDLSNGIDVVLVSDLAKTLP